MVLLTRPHDEPVEALSDVEQSLVDLARRKHPGVVTEAARAAADRFDRTDPAAAAAQRNRRRTLSFHQDDDGMGSLSGTLTPVAVTIRERDQRAYAAQAGRAQTGRADCSGGGAGHARVNTSLGTTMSIARMLHLACEAEIVPVVLNDAGGIMSHGRVKRRATGNPPAHLDPDQEPLRSHAHDQPDLGNG